MIFLINSIISQVTTKSHLTVDSLARSIVDLSSKDFMDKAAHLSYSFIINIIISYVTTQLHLTVYGLARLIVDVSKYR